MTVELFSIGFRPFYLGAGLFAAIAVPLWSFAFLSGSLSIGDGPSAYDWHTHEMVFGFAPAVVVGFLLTAVRTWTGHPTPSGPALAMLFGLWLAGRVLGLLDLGPFIDVSFLPVAAIVIAIPLWKSRSWRNAFVVPLLLLLAAASLTHHAAIRGWLAGLPPSIATTLALDLILVLMVVIGGRVIPAFSGNAIRELNPRSWLPLEVLAIGLPVVVLIGDALAMDPASQRWLYSAAALIQVLRMLGWQVWKTWRNPLLLALPLAYLWIPVHLLARAELPGVAVHALTVGGMAGLMLAMMTRSALGHTGRPLRAGAAECVCFAAIHLAAVCRVFGPVIGGTHYTLWILAATVCWTMAFGTFVLSYWGILTRPAAGR